MIEYRGYNIKKLGTFPMVEIKAKGQGMVPKSLDGLFTTTETAKRQIDSSLQMLLKGKSNGKAKATSKD